jgi:Ca2+/Na+ antiporter
MLDAAVGLLIMGVAAAMVAGLASPWAAAIALVPLIALYVLVLTVPRTRLAAFRQLLRGVPQSFIETAYEVTHDRPTSRHGSWTPVALLPVAVAAVVGGAYVMVRTALDAQSSLHLSDAVVGTIVLAALTSLPNLWLALHFARTDRGTALFSSAMNSNSINLVGGLVVPALFVGAGAAAGSLADFRWLAALTLLAVVAPLPSGRLNRFAGGLIIAIYLVFVLRRVISG